MEKEIKVIKIDAVEAECSLYDSEIFLMAWSNGDGFDLQLCGKNGGLQHISITYAEFDVIKKCVKNLKIVIYNK